MKNLFNKEVLVDILFIFILSLTPLLWFKKDILIVGHDNIFPMIPLTFLYGRLFTWIQHGFGQSQVLIMGTIPTHIIDTIPSVLGFSLQKTQEIVYIFWFFLMGAGAYILASTINSKSRIFKLTAVLLYQYNFFILQGWWIFERTKFSAYIAFPLIIAVFLSVYRGKLSPFRAAVINSLILFIFNAGGLYGISLYGGFFVALGTFVIYFSIASLYQKKFEKIKKIIVLVILSFFGFLIINSYYIFPSTYQIVSQYKVGLQTNGGILGFVDWANEISANTSYINIFRLQGIPEWYDNPDHPYAKYFLSNPILIAISFLWPLLVILNLFIIKDKKKLEIVLYLFLVYLLGIFFTAGTHPPLGKLYQIFLERMPGAIAFRSPYYKFASSVFFSTSFLIAFLFDELKWAQKKFLFIGLLAIVLLYYFPYFTGNFFSWKKGFSTQLSIPSYVFEFGNWINAKELNNSRILLLPPNNPDSQYSVYNWGYLSFQALPTLFTNKPILVNDDKLTSSEKQLSNMVYGALSNGDKMLSLRLLSLLRIKYLLIQSDILPDTASPISMDSTAYERIVVNLKFPLVKQFGKWKLYQVTLDSLDPIFLTNSINVFSGSIQDINEYYDIFDNQNIFAFNSDIPEPLRKKEKFQPNFYVPDCLSCQTKDIPNISIPEGNVLPSSFLYPLVLFNDNLKLHKTQTKALIYDYLGVSVKRTGEIRELVKYGVPIPNSAFNNYVRLLRDLKNAFMRSNYREKFESAQDVSTYLNTEREALSSTLGIYIVNGGNVVKIGHIAEEITSVLDTIDPYLFKADPVSSRFYELSLVNSGIYSIYIKKDDFQVFSQEDGKVSMGIDSSPFREIKLDSNALTQNWLSFGKITLEKGIHHIQLVFPSTANLINGLKFDTTEFNSKGNTSCYTTNINNFDSRKIYFSKLTYNNDFSTDLLYYIWEIGDKEKVLTTVFKLKSGSEEKNFINYIQTRRDAKEVIIGLCTVGLTNDYIQKKISLTVNEMIYPKILLVSKAVPAQQESAVTFKKISSTKYHVSFINKSSSTILTFMERFDNGWKLNNFNNNHFEIAGYGNAWLIDKTGQFELDLEYEPQKIFILGAIVSVIFAMVSIGYLIFYNKNNHAK